MPKFNHSITRRFLSLFQPSRSSQYIQATNRFGSYCVPRSSAHRPAAKRILNGMVHEPRTINFIRSHLKQGDVVHAGTYFGDFIPGIASKMSGNQLLWAFEPVPENYQCAKKTVEMNGLENVRLFNNGLGKKEETVEMVVTDPQGNALGGGSRIAKKHRNRAIPITIKTIDDMIPEDRVVTVIQLDVEGHELPALQGAWETIQRNWPILILEVLGKNRVLEDPWFVHHILAAGYQCLGKVHENIVLSRPPVEVDAQLLR